MKKLLGLLAIAPLAIASCTTDVSAEAQTFTVLLDKDGAEVEYTVEINEHSDYFIDYIFSNQIDVEFELSHSAWGYSVNAIDGVAHSCETDGYKGSYWQFLEDGTSASFGISSLEPKAGSTYEFNNNGDWCSFDWDSQTSKPATDFEAGGAGMFTGVYIDDLSGSAANGFTITDTETVYTQEEFINNSGVDLVVGTEYQVYFSDTTYGGHTGGYNTVYMSSITVAELKEVTA